MSHSISFFFFSFLVGLVACLKDKTPTRTLRAKPADEGPQNRSLLDASMAAYDDVGRVHGVRGRTVACTIDYS